MGTCWKHVQVIIIILMLSAWGPYTALGISLSSKSRVTCDYEEGAYYLGWNTWTCSRALSSKNHLPQTPWKLWWGTAGCHTCPSLWLRAPSRVRICGELNAGDNGHLLPRSLSHRVPCLKSFSLIKLSPLYCKSVLTACTSTALGLNKEKSYEGRAHCTGTPWQSPRYGHAYHRLGSWHFSGT